MYFRDENLRISLLFTLLDSRFVGHPLVRAYYTPDQRF